MRLHPALRSNFLLLICSLHGIYAAQFCTHDLATTRTAPFCAAIAVAQNASTNAFDIYLTVTARPDAERGWWAIGLGDRMDGALMFVIYPQDSENGVIVSTRSTTAHAHPFPASAAPDIRILRNSHHVLETQSYSASLVCYNCSRWPSTAIDALSSSQSFIWAANGNQRVMSREDADLDFHTDFGRFWADLGASRGPAGDGSSPLGPILEIGEWGQSAGVQDREKKDSKFSGSRLVILIHSILLIAAFMIIFPTGMVAIGYSGPRAFQTHWQLQVSALSMTIVGAGIGLIFSLNKPAFRDLSAGHQILGLAVSAMVLLQAVLGWRHHVIFKNTRRRTKISDAHVWLGRALILAGMMNVGMGIRLKHHGWRNSHFLIWFSFMAVEMLAMIFWMLRRRQTNRAYTKVPDPDVSAEAEAFTLLSRDEESDDESAEFVDPEQKSAKERSKAT